MTWRTSNHQKPANALRSTQGETLSNQGNQWKEILFYDFVYNATSSKKVVLINKFFWGFDFVCIAKVNHGENIKVWNILMLSSGHLTLGHLSICLKPWWYNKNYFKSNQFQFSTKYYFDILWNGDVLALANFYLAFSQLQIRYHFVSTYFSE